jgi:hypothetical protein
MKTQLQKMVGWDRGRHNTEKQSGQVPVVGVSMENCLNIIMSIRQQHPAHWHTAVNGRILLGP